MKKYRHRRTQSTGPEIVTGPSQRPLPVQREPAYMSLAERYGLSEDMFLAGGDNSEEQTIEQEYQAYATAPVTASNVDMIKYWEVWK
jgi:hypothetical protein